MYMRILSIIALSVLLTILAWPQLQSSAPANNNTALRDLGKQVFTSRCGKCHDADASKKLADGSTLLSRLAASKDPKALLGTRLKSLSPEDARGVAFYVEELTAAFRAAQKTPGR
jgi:mono/diheme cytochrome c family protein